ncbi:MAG: MBL fold metallo-hydrolase [Alphaproteobacteria bacterium]|nr:MBL fold metallo-hydrolase [Alphaproteobacteria bacterium]
MKIQIIGSDFAFGGMNTSFFFRDDSNRGVLVDCGFTVFPELLRRDMTGDIDVVLVSHPHPDHTGSLCTLAIFTKLYRNKILMIGGYDVAGIFKETGIRQLEDYVPLPPDDPISPKMIQTKHIAGHGHNDALFIADTILYSGDTNESVLDTDYARNAKIIFHEATHIQTPQAHTTFDKLNSAAPEIKAKTWLVHIPLTERAELEKLAAEYGFAGVCYNGQEIEI